MEEIMLRVSPAVAANRKLLEDAVKREKNLGEIGDFRIVSRSIDARQKRVMVQLKVRVAAPGEKLPALGHPVNYHPVAPDAPQIIIVGAGPAGLFAALRAIEHGMRPIVVERGKDVDNRRADIALLSRTGEVNPDSNYCFGEGGAGTFSDGKLYTRSKKRGSVEEVLQGLHQHGASEDILIDAHPHIGSDVLPKVIKNIRQTIVDNGGKVLFETRMSEILIEDNRAVGILTSDGNELRGPVVLATGHSARDVYRMLHAKGVAMEPKGLAIGVRLEHPQELIDRIQYHNPKGRGQWLPPAEYSFVTQVDGRGVYSFCMCPGGVVVPSASGPDQSAVNGMSSSARNSQWANSGMVVELHPGDVKEYADGSPLEMLNLQEGLEKNFFRASGNTLKAPAQRMADFVKGKISVELPSSSYAPGLQSAPVHFLLPDPISKRLQKGFEAFGKRAKGFLTNDATVIGLESRTSSPVRLPRDPLTMQHTQIAGLYPVGEGAGMAGGIVSAAIDGRRAIDAMQENRFTTQHKEE